MVPQPVQTMRRPNHGTGTSSTQASTLSAPQWWHCQQHTASDRTPFARVLASLKGPSGDYRRFRCFPVNPTKRNHRRDHHQDTVVQN